MSGFSIDLYDFEWIDGIEDDPEDLCLHGTAKVSIGDEKYEDRCTVSAAAIVLLRTLTENHILGKEWIQMLPCCGHSMFANEDLTAVNIIGCNDGIDWSVIHEGEYIKLITESGKCTLVHINEYEKEVFKVVDKVESYYKNCKEKVFSDDIDKEGYMSLWKEWEIRRRNKLVEIYYNGLKNKYLNSKDKEDWYKFNKLKYGANVDKLNQLKEKYEEVPGSLIELLKIVDGTYFRKYGDEEINLCFLGSDIEKCPYYLNSVDQIMENENIAIDYYASHINREYEDVYVDERIHNNSEEITWLHFSDCMNNGGTSRLFIDFTPSDTGKKGQVIRCIQDPDKLVVIADSFDEYLRNIICNKFDFIETMADVETSIKIEEKKKRFSFIRLFLKKVKGLS